MISGSNESDFGTEQTQAQGGGITKGYSTESGKVARVNHQTPFDVLHHRGLIDDKQWEAGERLRRDAYVSGKFAYIKSSADFSVKGHITDQAADYIAEASIRYSNAIKSLDRYEEAIVSLIVIEEGYIKFITDRKLRLNGMAILRSGLDSLVKIYGV